jgi:dolichol-phosphate mannosyltransferase
MNRCFLFVCLFSAILLTVLGWFWVGQPPSNQELLANTAKALDYAEGWKSVGGPPWWTPNFLQGSSLAPHLTTLVSMLVLLLSTTLAGLFAGPKIAALGLTFLAVAGVYAWVRRLTAEPLAGAAAALAFLLGAPLYLRLVHVEHMVFVAAFAVIPLVLLRLTIFLEEPTRLNGLFFGASYSLLMLTYAKAAFLLLPLALLYAVVLWLWQHRTWRLPGSALLAAFLAVFLLGALPLLPAFREMRIAALFELAPFDAWQAAFSLKSNIVWFDREGLLTAGMAPGFSAPSSFGGNYLGLVPLLLVGLVLIFRPGGLYTSRLGSVFRLAIALVLAAHWLSFGPRPVLLGQLAFLKMAVGAPDISIAISWFLLVIQGWVIIRLLPPRMPGRLLIGSAAIAAYLLIPGFRLISWLPVFADFRAPHDFSQIAGIFFFAAAVGCAVRMGAELPAKRLAKAALALLLCILACLDVAPYLKKFFHGPLDRKVFADFQDGMKFLAESAKPGWVFPLSGRYFYLLTPHFTRRGLTSEAFNSYLMLRGVNHLQMATLWSAPLLHAYLNTGGVAFVLIDKNDPDTDKDLQERFRSILKTAFENDNFLILENPGSLAPAFLASQFVSGGSTLPEIVQTGLSLEKQGTIVLPDNPAANSSPEGRVGTLEAGGPAFSKPLPSDVKFSTLALARPRWENFHRIALAAPDKAGWVVIPEAFHPDWTAASAGAPLPVTAANGAFLAVRAAQPGQPVTLTFSPPWWYAGFFFLSAGSWVGLGLLLVGLRLPVPAPAFRAWLNELPGLDRSPGQITEFSRTPIQRSVVVIPTYNESTSLPRTLEKVFSSHDRVEVLVVDDASPDGTGELVKNHPAFGSRLHLLPRAGKLGLGTAYKEGFQWAFEHGFDACLEMDADLSHDPADIPRLLQALDDGADAAIGSRYLGGVRVMNWPEGRLFLSTGASRFVRLVTGLPLTDATSGFKALRVSVLRTLDWKKFRAGGYGFQVELHHALWQAGARMVEVPIIFTERRDGETKMTIGIALEAAWRTIRLGLDKK